MPLLSNGVYTIHPLRPGYEWVTDPKEPLRSDDLVEWASKHSDTGFETVAEIESRIKSKVIGEPASIVLGHNPTDTHRCVVMRPMDTPDELKKILDRSSPELNYLRQQTVVDFDHIFNLSPLSLSKKTDKANVIALMKKVRGEVLHKLNGQVYSKQEVEDAYKLGLTYPCAVKITKTIECLAQEIDHLPNNHLAHESIRQQIQILRNGLDYLEQSFNTAVGVAVENPSIAQLAKQADGIKGDKDVWYYPVRLEYDTTDKQIRNLVVYRSAGTGCPLKWYYCMAQLTLDRTEFERWMLYRPATAEEITAAGGNPADNDFLKDIA
jgi:hypothetical protein